MVTLDKLIERALRRAEQNNGIGEAVLNGRQKEYYRFGLEPFIGELEEKYAIAVDNGVITLRHWGTITLVIDVTNKQIIDVYGESVSDRDSINYMLRRYNMGHHVHYYPSREEFELHQDQTERVLQVI